MFSDAASTPPTITNGKSDAWVSSASSIPVCRFVVSLSESVLFPLPLLPSTSALTGETAPEPCRDPLAFTRLSRAQHRTTQSHAPASTVQVLLCFFQQLDIHQTNSRSKPTDPSKDLGCCDMAVRGWTPINWIVAGTDDEGNDVYKLVQLPLLPPKRHRPVGHCLGRDRLTHNHHVDEYGEDGEVEGPNSSALATSPPKTSATRKTGIKKAQPKPKQVEYQVYSVNTSDQAMIDSDPDLLHYGNIYRIAQKYNMAELAEAVNASHDTTKYTAGLFGNRLQRAVNRKAERDGTNVTVVQQELQKVQKENEAPLNGRKRKTVVDEIEERKNSRKRKADGQIEGEQAGKKQKPVGIAEDKDVVKKRVLTWEIPQPSSPHENHHPKPVEDSEGKQLAKKRVLPWGRPHPSSPNRNRQKTAENSTGKEIMKKRVLPWEIAQPSLPSQNRQQVPKQQKAVEDGEGKELMQKRKPADDREDTRLAKKSKIAETIDFELDKENGPEKEPNVGKENGVSENQAKSDREVLSSGFVMWNI